MAVIDSFNKVVDIARELGNAPLKKALIQVRDEVIQLVKENQHLREENRRLREQLEPPRPGVPPEDRVKFERGAYWLVEDNDTRRGPMCKNCWEGSKILQRSIKQLQDFYMCPECGIVARLPGVDPS